jgi:hypothetical protein
VAHAAPVWSLSLGLAVMVGSAIGIAFESELLSSVARRFRFAPIDFIQSQLVASRKLDRDRHYGHR